MTTQNGLFLALAPLLALAATVFGVLAVPSMHHGVSGVGHHEHPTQLGTHHAASGVRRDEHPLQLAAHGGAKEENDVLDAGEALAAFALSILALALVLIGSSTRSADSEGVLRLAVAVVSAGAAAIHFAVIDQHLVEYWLFGLFFVAVAVAQLGWVVAVSSHPIRPVYIAGALGNALIAVTWLVSRTTGLPLGPGAGEPEPVGIADVVSTAFELAVVVGTLLLLRGHALRRSWEMRFARPVVALATIAFTTLALAGLAGL
jgi:hypothetical protein